MQASLRNLEKYLLLEINRKFDNKAVFGGLPNILTHWENQAREDQIKEELFIDLVKAIKKYPELSLGDRAFTVKQLLASIGSSRVVDISVTKEKTQAKKTKSKKAGIPRKNTQEEAIRQQANESNVGALEASVTVLEGVGPKNAERLQKIGVHNLRDMLFHLPRRHEDFSNLLPIRQVKYGQSVTISGEVISKSQRLAGKRRLKINEIIVEDDSAAIKATWMNQPWITKNISEGDQVVLSGTIDQYLGRLVFNNPEMERLEEEQLHTNRIVPIYPLTAKIGQRWLRTLMNKVIHYWAPRIEDPLPISLIKSAEVIGLSDAIRNAHFPASWEELQAANERLAFQELFLIQLGALQSKSKLLSLTSKSFTCKQDWEERQFSFLPFALTNAQIRSWKDIKQDLASGQPMNRLLQGDVGSGKTVVAALAMSLIASEKAQAAIMAPTSILAEQHFKSLKALLVHKTSDIQENDIALIIGATPEKEKRVIRESLINGKIKILIGTHSLIEDSLIFENLALIVIDEQHRFGVQQRAKLRAKGSNPHLLVMTATPIPRSLALTVYGDLDVSVIDELPPGRQLVSTHILLPKQRDRANKLIREKIGEGRQAFIIFPLIEGFDGNEVKAAVEQHKVLQRDIFPDLSIDLLHGRMKADKKEKIMTRFRDGQTDILVSTTVIEVGVDIPNASVMLIESANRFGLAQLHQLRGRVGRGAEKSYCLLIPDHEDDTENERLQAMVETNDGFILAERDLEQRGPGEFLGMKQSGYASLRFASLTDSRMIVKARKHAMTIINEDPEIRKPEHQTLAVAIKAYRQIGQGDIS